jgi:hypothetical protein
MSAQHVSYAPRSRVGFRTRRLEKAAETAGRTLLRSGGSERGDRRDSVQARTFLSVEKDSTAAETWTLSASAIVSKEDLGVDCG